MNSSFIRPVVYIASLCGLYMATAMFIPAITDLYYGNRDWQNFALSAFIVGGISLSAGLATRGRPPAFNKRMGFLLVNVLWLTFSVAGAVPLVIAAKMPFAKAFFESVSAVTTTGSTVMVGLDNMPRGILMWRSLLQWLGGIGIVALGLFVLPFLRVGGIAFFKMESSDTNDKPFARLASFTSAFVAIYVALTVLCIITYDLLGMSHFDAINHALTTLPTGGFSTHDSSFGFFGNNVPLLWAATIFMTVASLPFSILILFVVRRRLDALRDPQIVLFLGYMAAFVVATAVYARIANGTDFFYALTHSAFNFSSLLSTTGYASLDYTLWGPFMVTLVFAATFVGGCSGSTAGGIKAYRFVVIFNTIRAGFKMLIYPNAIYRVRYGHIAIDEEVQRSVFLFLSSYLFLWLLGAAVISAFGFDLTTALTASITALSNVGPGLGEIVGPAGNFSTMPDTVLYVLSLLMLLGRLEVLTVIVIFTPLFWRD
ncbi:TrkH family potassium uptake protein [Rhizobium sp. L1K21]|uniref:TrkH family potassium uptake protein n=1 Tax=Rhizobium sp. L1K21 TaxID=2954933 RepID=UPI0020925488|nr:TrkH family potassium uptake protein [Rhizobium sp. L1K21]